MEVWLHGEPTKPLEKWEETGAGLEEQLCSKPCIQRSYDGHDEQREMMEATDYTDEWLNQEGAIFRSYYVCMAGGSADPCGTMVTSDMWDRHHADPLAVKQRWYCTICGS